MIRATRRAALLGLMLALVAGPAWAAVTLTFYAHPGARVRDGYLLFPHAYVWATGTLDDTGEAVDWAAGYTARDPGPHLLFVRGVGEVQHPDPRYVSEGRAFVRLTVDDAVYRAIRARADWWAGPEGSVYDLRRRNCISFIADLARVAGLRTAPEPSMKPGSFLEATARLNPAAAWSEEQMPPGPSADDIAPETTASDPGAQSFAEGVRGRGISRGTRTQIRLWMDLGGALDDRQQTGAGRHYGPGRLKGRSEEKSGRVSGRSAVAMDDRSRRSRPLP